MEFALVALVLYVLLFGLVEFGRATLFAQGAEQAARVAARELALAPLPASLTFDEALETDFVRERIYNPDFLVIDLAAQVPELDGLPGQSALEIDAFFATLPVVNRSLRGLMYLETLDLGDSVGSRTFLRYPGALLLNPNATPGASRFTVGIPEVVGRGPDGEETIVWRRVLEEARRDPLAPATPATSPFSVLSPEGGLVSVRIHVPFQAATLASYRAPGGDLFAPNLASPNLADDSAVVPLPTSPPPPGGVIDSAPPLGAYGGPFGLGRLLAFGQEVRPFRRLFAAQSIQRRELPLGP